IAADLDPDVHVRCRLDGQITVERQRSTGFQPVRGEQADGTHGLETRRVAGVGATSGAKPRRREAPNALQTTTPEPASAGASLRSSPGHPAPVPRLTSGARQQTSGARHARRISFFDELTITAG